jgi:hypothetical protein
VLVYERLEPLFFGFSDFFAIPGAFFFWKEVKDKSVRSNGKIQKGKIEL